MLLNDLILIDMVSAGLVPAVSQVLVGIATAGFLLASVLLILVVLIQRPQGGGLSGAFGAGAGSGQTAFGAKTGDALTWATVAMFVIWLLIAVTLVFWSRPQAAAPLGTNAGLPGAELPLGAAAEGEGEGPSIAVEDAGEGPNPQVIDVQPGDTIESIPDGGLELEFNVPAQETEEDAGSGSEENPETPESE